MKADTQYTITKQSTFQSLERNEHKEVLLLNKIVHRLLKQNLKERKNKLIQSSNFTCLILG